MKNLECFFGLHQYRANGYIVDERVHSVSKLKVYRFVWLLECDMCKRKKEKMTMDWRPLDSDIKKIVKKQNEDKKFVNDNESEEENSIENQESEYPNFNIEDQFFIKCTEENK